MKIITYKYAPWSGAVSTYDRIYDKGKMDEFENLIDELYPDGIEETKLNDILWFDSEYILESLGIPETIKCGNCDAEIDADEWEENGSPSCNDCDIPLCPKCVHYPSGEGDDIYMLCPDCLASNKEEEK